DTGDCLPALFLECVGARYLVYFHHSNGEDLGMCYNFACRLRHLLEVHVLIMEYPGYGICPGKPSEDSFRQASQICLNFAKKVLRIPSSDIIIVGRSLGAAVALQVAATSAACGLVLIAPFLSLQDAVGQFVGQKASKLLVKNIFCNSEVIKTVKAINAQSGFRIRGNDSWLPVVSTSIDFKYTWLQDHHNDLLSDDQAELVSEARSLPESDNPVESVAAELLLSILRFYRQYISPYGIEVVKRYGSLKGLILFLWRLLRCTPLFPVDRDRIVWAYDRFCMSDEPEDPWFMRGRNGTTSCLASRPHQTVQNLKGPKDTVSQQTTAKTAMLKQKEVPVLVIHGDRDMLVDCSQGIGKLDVCETKRFVSPPGMGHNDDLLANVDLLWRPMMEFFALPDYDFRQLRLPKEAFDKHLCPLYHGVVEMTKHDRPLPASTGDEAQEVWGSDVPRPAEGLSPCRGPKVCDDRCKHVVGDLQPPEADCDELLRPSHPRE
ncbi:abhd17c, partial [Symbiodinium necroappetens]